jgi:flagellin-like protein
MNLRDRIKALKADEGVSPVIAVILMVAITVVLAATVYVWVSGFASDQEGPEQASATATGVDLDDNGTVEWVKVTLTSGENAPYSAEDVTFSVTDQSGAAQNFACDDASNAACEGGTEEFRATDDDEWDAGQNLWIPCQGDGNHLITASVRGSTILDASVKCDHFAS